MHKLYIYISKYENEFKKGKNIYIFKKQQFNFTTFGVFLRPIVSLAFFSFYQLKQCKWPMSSFLVTFTE